MNLLNLLNLLNCCSQNEFLHKFLVHSISFLYRWLLMAFIESVTVLIIMFSIELYLPINIFSMFFHFKESTLFPPLKQLQFLFWQICNEASRGNLKMEIWLKLLIFIECFSQFFADSFSNVELTFLKISMPKKMIKSNKTADIWHYILSLVRYLDSLTCKYTYLNNFNIW